MTGRDSLEDLRERLRAFAQDRDWERFHTAKNLSAAIAGEAGELVSVLQWATGDADLKPHKAELEDEVADVLIYLVRLCDVADIDLPDAALRKIQRNEVRYPRGENSGPAAGPPEARAR
jgi:dCTP diphosphatase